MSVNELRERAETLAARAIGGADIAALAEKRDALFKSIVDALIEFEPRRELLDPRELQRMVDRLTGAGTDYTHRYVAVRRALADITSLLDRIDTPQRHLQ